MDETIAEKEVQLNQLLQAGKTEEAVELICRLAILCARQNDFERADAFRDQLYEVDSMALSAIVNVNEAIEAEKTKALTPDRRRLWAKFFKELTPEEINAFFFALREINVESETILLKQGEPNDRLYLINQGQLKMVHDRDDKQILIHTIGPGDTVGEDTFFSINVSTVTVATLSKSKLSYLERAKLEDLRSKFPTLEQSLVKICGSERKIFEWVRQKGLERRAHKRINLNTKVWFQVLSPDGNPAMQRPVVAELWDISKSGLSFYFGSKNKQAVSRLVGRTLGVRFYLTISGKEKEVALTGVVQGVRDHPLDEYSVHIKLRRNFSDEAIKAIYRIAQEE
ncbi:MAG: cyclic nucleotide-binding domain-containing protein [Desulfobacteraceae bacterium]|nr:cyclic nucleotide-binding domain-containing protein [Desulfobacteraceae bacterium]